MTAMTRAFQRALTEYCDINTSAAINETPISGNVFFFHLYFHMKQMTENQ